MRVGVVGCGQLARMMALAGLPLGIKFSFLNDDGASTACVDGLGLIASVTDQSDGEALYEALGKPDVITIEKEQLDVALLDSLKNHCAIYPPVDAAYQLQHRLREKQLLTKLSIPTAQYIYAEKPGDVQEAIDTIGYPLFLKSVDMGYDGKNQYRLFNAEDADNFFSSVTEGSFIAEQGIDFVKEASLIGVRSKQGDMHFYASTENVHSRGTLVSSIAPAQALSDSQLDSMHKYLAALLTELDYVGVLSMECFITQSGVLVNELAPRVHNSGHWTQNGAQTSQFENHVRAISGIALGSTEQVGLAGMINLLGSPEVPVKALSQQSTAHWYNKQPKPRRKVGHVNFTGASLDALQKDMDSFVAQYTKHYGQLNE